MVKIKLSLYHNTLLHLSPEGVNGRGELCWFASVQHLTGKRHSIIQMLARSIISSTSAYVVRLISCKSGYLNGRCSVQLSSPASTSRGWFMPCSERHRRQEECIMLCWAQLSALIPALWVAVIQASFIMQLFALFSVVYTFFPNSFLLNFWLSQAQIFLFHLCFYLSCMAFTYSLPAQEFLSVKLSQGHTKVINKNVPWVA